MLQLNRTALHYAYAIADEEIRTGIVQILTEAAADGECLDYKERNPLNYQDLSEEVSAMKQPMEAEKQPANDEAAQPANEEAAQPANEETAPAGDVPAADVPAGDEPAGDVPAADEASIEPANE